MKNVKTTLIAMLGFSAVAIAQTGDLPPSAEPGKCYVKCVTPDIYETVEERVMVRPAYKKLEVEPAQYKTVTERVLIKPESKRYEYVPAKFETYYEDMRVEDEYNKVSTTAASFKPDAEKIEIEPKIGRWEYRSYADCESENPADCKVLCWVEYDPVMETVPIQKLKNDASTSKTTAGGKVIKVKKQRIVQKAQMKEIKVPAEYREIDTRVLVKDETVKETNVPAEYKTVKVEKLKQKGGVGKWEEISCDLIEYNLLPIFYELGSARLTAKSKQVINEKIYDLMKDKPLVRVEISSHTDSRGSSASNKSLSERRAQSVVNYLIARGINSSRLVARGFGEERLVNRCADGVACTEKEHQANRRTEFRVISY